MVEFLKRLAAGWRKHWRAQLPTGFFIAISFLSVFGVIKSSDWALYITTFVTIYPLIKSKSKPKPKSQ